MSTLAVKYSPSELFWIAKNGLKVIDVDPFPMIWFTTLSSSMGFVVMTPTGSVKSKRSDNDPLAVTFTVVAIPQDIVIAKSRFVARLSTPWVGS